MNSSEHGEIICNYCIDDDVQELVTKMGEIQLKIHSEREIRMLINLQNMSKDRTEEHLKSLTKKMMEEVGLKRNFICPCCTQSTWMPPIIPEGGGFLNVERYEKGQTLYCRLCSCMWIYGRDYD